MNSTLLKGLLEERIVSLGSKDLSRFPFPIKGIVRILSKKGDTVAILFSKEALEEFEEELDATDPSFLASLEDSRKSGLTSAKELKRKMGLKK